MTFKVQNNSKFMTRSRINRNSIRLIFFVCLCFLLLSPSTAIDVAPQWDKSAKSKIETVIKRIDGSTVSKKELDSELPKILKAAGLPAISIAVINDYRIVYFNTFGVKNTQTKEPVNNDTLFEAASLTKPILAFTAMKLVEEGKLDLDKPLYKYLEHKDITYDPRHKMITARMVLSHSTGLINWRWMNKDKKLDIKFTPGTNFGYSGEAYFYLQKVIEKITDSPLEQIAQKMVFFPLKMTHSSLLLKDPKTSASGHNVLQPTKKRISLTANAAASLHTTADDYARFVISFMKNNILSANSITEMLSPQISVSKKDADLSWGLGWSLKKTDVDTFYWHWGDNVFFKAFALASLKKGHGVVYFINSNTGHSIMKHVVKLTFGHPMPILSHIPYPQYDGPAAVIEKIVMSKGLAAGLKKYDEWITREPGAFIEGELNILGYKLLGNNKYEEAAVFFKKNVGLYPKSANVYTYGR